MSFAFGSSFTTACVLIRLAASAYRKVLSVSSSDVRIAIRGTRKTHNPQVWHQRSVHLLLPRGTHEIAAIMAVLELPPKLSFNNHVRTESR